MGYLGETWNAYDQTLALASCSNMQRHSMRVAYYLGVRAMLDAICESGELDQPQRVEFIKDVAREWHDFQEASTAEAVEWMGGLIFGDASGCGQ
ncbi:hypothetical protein [Caballeronia sp. BR00000012568055]|uniref:hypothetical protein n=1 Tax=Caballeronia sp. BR00000012568055 TaxID=2918761 RepID=UPI0023F8A126|nr:hypothetical protein [Caballeronia sp. BR00000012568055]